jgi:carbamoyl-phosphate synthase large subunit
MGKQNITVAVTGLNNIDSPGPGIPVIRALKESSEFNVRIIGLVYDALEPGIYMRDLVDKCYRLPLPSAGQEILLNRIREIHKAEKIDVIIPNFDAELFNFIRLQQTLEQEGIRSFLPTEAQFEERHKWVLAEFGKKYGIHVPKSRMLTSMSEVHDLAYEFGYPLMVKGKFYDAYVAYTPDQAMGHFSKISAKWGLPVIIQQYTQGTEVNLTGIGDGSGNLLGGVPMRKTYITDKGKAWAGITLEDNKLVNIAAHFVKQTKWRGGFELEMIRTDNNEYQLIEINPRFPAWVYLAVGVGQNHPETLVKLALGKDTKAFETYETGKMFVRYSYDQIVDLASFEAITTQGEF